MEFKGKNLAKTLGISEINYTATNYGIIAAWNHDVNVQNDEKKKA